MDNKDLNFIKNLIDGLLFIELGLEIADKSKIVE